MTKRQQQVYDFIVDFMAAHGTAPTLREIMDHFNWASPNATVCHLKPLEAQGAIERGHDTLSRNITVTDPLAVLVRQIRRLPAHQREELKRRI